MTTGPLYSYYPCLKNPLFSGLVFLLLLSFFSFLHVAFMRVLIMHALSIFVTFLCKCALVCDYQFDNYDNSHQQAVDST